MINILLFAGLVLALGAIGGRIAHSLKLTGIVGYIFIGFLVGPILGLVNRLGLSGSFSSLWTMWTHLTLALVAFVIGAQLTISLIKHLGKPVLGMLFAESLCATFAVIIGITLFTGDLTLGLIFGAMAAATDPVATVGVLHEYHSKGPVTNALLTLVGWDDAIASTVVAIVSAVVIGILGGTATIGGVVATVIFRIFGGLFIGVVLGLLLVLVVTKIRDRESIFIYTLAIVLLGAGIAEYFDISLILTCMAIGITFINFLPRKGHFVRNLIEEIMPPLYVVFFVLVGMQLNFEMIETAGGLAAIYIMSRMFGKYGGISASARLLRAPRVFQKYLGFGMFSQGALALGLMALLGTKISKFSPSSSIPTLGITVITITTIAFEIIGPIGVRLAIKKAGETKRE